MRCPRCSLPGYHNQINEREFSFTCDFCGYHRGKFITHFHKNVPIFEDILLEPKGVIITDSKNFQYYSEAQKAYLLKTYPDNKGYTFYDNLLHEWKVNNYSCIERIDYMLSN